MKWCLIVVSWLTGLFFAQAQPFAMLDAHAQKVRFSEQSDLPSLVQQLIAPAYSDLEKARVLFVWTASNIRYDDNQVKPYQFGFAKKIDTLVAATQILRSRRGVCTDYSLVLYQLFRTAGLPVRIVTGYAKGHPGQAGTPIRSINHQWNMVFLKGKWQLLDATWASTNNGTRPLTMYYFLTPPDQFIANHFPDRDADQLIKTALTKTEFDGFPRVYDAYFSLCFGPDFPRQGLYQINRKCQLSIENTDDMEFVVLAHRYGQPKNERTFYYRAFRQKTGYNLAMQVFRDGVYSVHILSRPKGDLNDHQLVLTFTVISSH